MPENEGLVAMERIDHTKLQLAVNKFQRESDRACAVLAVATLDTLLENLLRRSMIADVPKELFQGNGPLQPFSAKIDAAYSYGLIAAEERSDFHILRKIRNDFAHDVDHELSFLTPKVADRVQALKLPRMFEGHPILTEGSSTIRWRFELCVAALITVVKDLRIKDVKPPSRPISIKGPR